MNKLLLLIIATSFFACPTKRQVTEEKVVVAYVTSWSNVVPNPFVMTHINYAFGHVTDSFDGVRIDNPERLRMLTELKRQNPQWHVLLSVGGWGSGRFSEMVASKETRLAFCRDCKRVMKEHNLDGIDIDSDEIAL